MADEISMNGAASCLVPAATETKFSMLHSITLLPFWEFLVTARRKNNQAHGIVFPTIALTVNLPPDVRID